MRGSLFVDIAIVRFLLSLPFHLFAFIKSSSFSSVGMCDTRLRIGGILCYILLRRRDKKNGLC